LLSPGAGGKPPRIVAHSSRVKLVGFLPGRACQRRHRIRKLMVLRVLNISQPSARGRIGWIEGELGIIEDAGMSK